jgi:hypothetical protein
MTQDWKGADGDWLAAQLFVEPERYRVDFDRPAKESTWKTVSKQMQCFSRGMAGAGRTSRPWSPCRRGPLPETGSEFTKDSEKGFRDDYIHQSGTLDRRLHAIGAD